MRIFLSWICAATSVAWGADQPSGRPVDAILADYVKALGGAAAIDSIKNREMKIDVHRASDVTLYWSQPNKVLSVGKRERMGFDGAHAWTLSAKSKVKKLPHGAEIALEMEANPLRFAHAQDLYDELNPAPAAEIDGQKMDVIIAPNKTGETKLYFDSGTHLLRRVEEKGESSVYFVNTLDYTDYQDVDGVRVPYRIVHKTTAPEVKAEDFKVKEITQNLELREEMFTKPLPGKVVLGGKR